MAVCHILKVHIESLARTSHSHHLPLVHLVGEGKAKLAKVQSIVSDDEIGKHYKHDNNRKKKEKHTKAKENGLQRRLQPSLPAALRPLPEARRTWSGGSFGGLLRTGPTPGVVYNDDQS